MPSLLLLNANVGGMSSGSALDLWRSSPTFLPPRVTLMAGTVAVTYEIKGVVIQVGTRPSQDEPETTSNHLLGSSEGTGHLVALIKGDH
jgi:hypothetical protein